jgi:transcriptional regulator with XRE-family HTH domain
MGRAALNIEVRELAKSAKVSTNTVTRLESGSRSNPERSRQFNALSRPPALNSPTATSRASA